RYLKYYIEIILPKLSTRFTLIALKLTRKILHLPLGMDHMKSYLNDRSTRKRAERSQKIMYRYLINTFTIWQLMIFIITILIVIAYLTAAITSCFRKKLIDKQDSDVANTIITL